MSGRLYIVATPIGNLEDITMRALRILGEADFIACEDTRVSAKLLNKYEISKPLVSYHEHNSAWMGENIIDRIEAGETCALVSDAGTPVISDPGAGLTMLCLQKGIEVVPIPGACAAIAALSASAMPAGRFCFEGFLSIKSRARREHLEAVKNEKRTMVFYEAPHKLLSTLKDMLDALGDRKIVLARELTKLHEEIASTTLSEAIEKYSEQKPRGEFVLIIAGARESLPEIGEEDVSAALSEDTRQSVKELKKLGLSRNEAYRLALEKKKSEE